MTQPDSNWLDQYKHVVVNLQLTMEETLSLFALLNTVGLRSAPFLQSTEHCADDDAESIRIDLANIMGAMYALNGKVLAKITPAPQPCMIRLATFGADQLVKDHAMEGIVRQAMDKLESQLADKPTD